MSEEYRNETGRRRKKKKKIKLGRVILVILIVAALIVGGGYYVVTKLLTPAPGEPITEPVVVEPVRLRTTFQDQINEEYANTTFVGNSDELDLVSKYFATNLFTMWGVDQGLIDYNGQDMIPPEFLDTFTKQVTGNLFFQYAQVIETYGADNLPIVTSVDAVLDGESWIEYNGEDYDSYTMKVIMHYQDGTAEGTQNKDYAKTNELLQQWVYSAEIDFFWIPGAEEGTGQWRVGAMKYVENIANATA